MQNLTPYNHPDYTEYPVDIPPSYASAWGQDTQGYWFEISVRQVVQRFRWAPRGRFSMGSPESEHDRETGLFAQGKETLHSVIFEQGFWLADTTCTQALWQVVMNDNPAEFKGDLQNPVERVSWRDAQQFLDVLNRQLPDLKACLPTEAQWEYACRAGTTTPFSLGENINPDQVNYNGRFPYLGDQEGEYRKQTIPVKELPANQWGLYQMHGNVWEWCFDEFRETLDITESINPVNASFKEELDPHAPQNSAQNLTNANQGNVFRVLRGGSWYRKARTCRSALRDRSKARNRYDRIGFRIVLAP